MSYTESAEKRCIINLNCGCRKKLHLLPEVGKIYAVSERSNRDDAPEDHTRATQDSDMTRIDVSLPEQFAFSTEIQIYHSHINRGGHLDNSLLLTLVAEARERFFESMGYVNLNVEGLSQLVVDMAVRYISEAFRGEVMIVHVAVGAFSKKGCDMLWKMTEKTSGREVARGKTGIVFYDRAARKVASVPDKFRQRVGV